MRQLIMGFGLLIVLGLAGCGEVIMKDNDVESSTIVAVLDSGINNDDACLDGRIVAEYDFSNNAEVAQDYKGHGTRMAQIILNGDQPNSLCEASTVKFIDAKVVSGAGLITTESILSAIQFSISHGASVINMSFSGVDYSSKLQDMITYYASQGVVFVASAGNEGRTSKFYPAAYDGVVAVGAKNAINEISVYSNHGQWVDEYLSDGIATIESGKFVQHYGTSETSALYVNQIINKQILSLRTISMMEWVQSDSSNEKYQLNALTEEELGSLFQERSSQNYLNSLSNYLAAKESIPYITGKMNDLNYAGIHSYSNSLFTNINSALVSNEDDYVKSFNASILMLDMFSSYMEVAYRDEYSKFKEIETPLLKLSEKITTLIEIFESIESSVKNSKAGLLPNLAEEIKPKLESLNKLVLSTRNETDPVAKAIRKYVNYGLDALDVKNRKSSGGYYTSASISKNLTLYTENLDKITAAVKYYNNVKAILDFTSTLAVDIDGLQKEYLFASMKLPEYLIALGSLNLNKEIYNANRTSLSKKVSGTAIILTNFDVDGSGDYHKKFVKALLAYGVMKLIVSSTNQLDVDVIGGLINKTVSNVPFLDVGKIVPLADTLGLEKGGEGGKLVSILKSNMLEKGWQKIGAGAVKKLNSVFTDTVEEVTRDQVNIILPSYMYLLYREMIIGLENEGVYSTKYGYINTQEIQSKALGSVLLRKFGYHTNRMLAEMAVTLSDNGANFGFSELAKGWEITETGATYSYQSWGLASNLKKAFSNLSKPVVTFTYKSRDFIVQKNTVAPNGESGVPGFISYVFQCGGKTKPECAYGTYLSDYFIIWDQIAFTISNYQSVLDNMAASSTMYDMITLRNEKNDNYINYINEVRNQATEQEEYEIYGNNPNIYPLVAKAINYERTYSIPIYTKDMLKKMDMPISRKDFFMMAMKLVGTKTYDEGWGFLNPYRDATFINRLMGFSEMSGVDEEGVKLSEYFTDIEKDYTERRLDYNDMVWAIYAKYNKLVSGNNGKYLGSDSISRGEAFAIVANAIAIPDSPNLRNAYDGINLKSLPELFTNIVEFKYPSEYKNFHESVFRNHATYLVKNKIIGGSCTGNSQERILNVEDKLTVFEASVILFNASELINAYAKSLPKSDGDKVDTCINESRIVSNNKWFSPSLAEIPTVVSGNKKKLTLNTFIKDEDADDYFINWLPMLGDASNYEKTLSDGYMSVSVDYEAPVVSQDQMIPIDVYITKNTGVTARKVYYVNVVPFDSINYSGTFSGSISSAYNAKDELFNINWKFKSPDNKAVIEYSYDQGKSWVSAYTLSTSSPNPISLFLSDSDKNSNVIFRIGSQDQWGETFELEYISDSSDYIQKGEEVPKEPVLSKLWGTNSTYQVELKWPKVNDSYGNDNVNYYEIEYATNPTFAYSVIINAGNNVSSVPNSNGLVTYIVNNLNNEEDYYFRVRAVNDIGVSSWSDYENTYVKVNELPVFEANSFYPADGSSEISKNPFFEWKANDSNSDDELIYYLRIEKDINDLLVDSNVFRQWTVNADQYDWHKEREKALSPGTTYYWQVSVKEKGRNKEYYGGRYPTSKIMSFTTESLGPDLIISDALLVGNISPGNYATFDLTIKNIGNEPIDSYRIDSYYQKSTGTFEFDKGSNKISHSMLQPQQTEIFQVQVRFDFDTWTSPSGVLYDNILEAGNTKIKFEIKEDSRESSSSNNAYEYSVNYVDKGRPKFAFVNLVKTNGGYYKVGSSYSNMVCYSAEDDILLSKFTLEYQLTPDGPWTLLDTHLNNDESTSHCTRWDIPDDRNYATENLLFRVRAYDSETTYSEIITERKRVYSNELQGNIVNYYLERNKVGSKAFLQLNVTSEYPIASTLVSLNSGGRNLDIYENASIGQDVSVLELEIPGDDFYASNSATLEVTIKDSIGDVLKLSSSSFQLNPNISLPNPFEDAINLYPEQKDNSEADVRFLKIDDNNIVHVIYEEQIDSTSDRSRQRKFYYRYYNYNNDTLSSPYEVAIGSFNDSTGKYFFENNIIGLHVYENDVYVLKYDQFGGLSLGRFQNNRFYYSFISNDNISNITPYVGFVEGGNKKLYAYYRVNSDVTQNRRYYLAEIESGNVKSPRILVDEYISGFPSFNSRTIFSGISSKGYSFDENMNVIGDILISSDQSNGHTHEFSSDDASYLISFYRDGDLYFFKEDGSEVKIELKDVPALTSYPNGSWKDIRVINNKVYVLYNADNAPEPGRNNYLQIYNIETSESNTWILGRTKDDEYYSEMVDSNNSGMIALGTLKKGANRTPYLAVSKFDIESENYFDVNFNITDDEFFKNEITNIEWNISGISNIEYVARVDLYEQTSTGRQLLNSLSNSSITNFEYTPIGESGFRLLEIEVTDITGKVVKDSKTINVVSRLVFNNFYVDQSFALLGDTINFNWSVSGSDSNTLFKVYRQSQGNEEQWTKIFTIIGSTSAAYTVNNFVGKHRFKIEASGSSLNTSKYIDVTGNLFDFDRHSFFPTSIFSPDQDGMIDLTWKPLEGSSSEIIYTVYIKPEGESTYSRYPINTRETSTEYFIGDKISFSWYVVASVDDYSVQSDVFNVDAIGDQRPVISNADIKTSIDGFSVVLTMTSPLMGGEYAVYRDLNGTFELIGSTESNVFEDTDVISGSNYRYSVIQISSDVESDFSETYEIKTPSFEFYDAIIDNITDEPVSVNGFTVNYSPSKVVPFENYQIKWGESPSSLEYSLVTQERSFIFENLTYATAYYMEIITLGVEGTPASTTPAKLSFTTEFDPKQLVVPPVVSVDSYQAFSIELSWNEIDGADQYSIFRSTDGGSFQLVNKIAGNSYKDTIGLTPSTDYIYKIRAENISNSVWSNLLQVSTNDIPDSYDSDKDGIPDLYELNNGMNPLFPDSNEDFDGDLISNLDEYLQGTDPLSNTDDLIPLVIAPDDISVMSKGLLTKINLGVATAKDSKGNLLIPLPSSTNRLFRPGRHIISWSAVDSNGKQGTDMQIIDVKPKVYIEKEQMIREGDEVRIPIWLNGDAPLYPVIVPYTISGSAIEGTDHNLSSGEFTINEGIVGEINFKSYADGLVEDNEIINVSLSSSDNASVEDYDLHRIIVSDNEITKEVEILVSQFSNFSSEFNKFEGSIKISSNLIEDKASELYLYSWSFEGFEVFPDINRNSKTIEFNPSTLDDGIYTVHLNVAHNDDDISASLSFKLKSDSPALSSQSDSDNDNLDDLTEGVTDKDGDGVPDYLDPLNNSSFLLGNTDNYFETYIESKPGQALRIGKVSLLSDKYGANVSDADIANSSSYFGYNTEIAESEFSLDSEIYDFEVRKLNVGDYVEVTIKLPTSLSRESSYRIHDLSSGWREFDFSTGDRVMSSPLIDENCPSTISSYQDGVMLGAQCIRLVIKDGGLNDNDARDNGMVLNMGALVFNTSIKDEENKVTEEPGSNADSVVENISATGGGTNKGSSSGGVLSLYWLIIYFALLFFRKGALQRFTDHICWQRNYSRNTKPLVMILLLCR